LIRVRVDHLPSDDRRVPTVSVCMPPGVLPASVRRSRSSSPYGAISAPSPAHRPRPRRRHDQGSRCAAEDLREIASSKVERPPSFVRAPRGHWLRQSVHPGPEGGPAPGPHPDLRNRRGAARSALPQSSARPATAPGCSLSDTAPDRRASSGRSGPNPRRRRLDANPVSYNMRPKHLLPAGPCREEMFRPHVVRDRVGV